MAVGSDQRNRGAGGLDSDDPEALYRASGMSPDDFAQAEQDYYDEQAAGIAREEQMSAIAERVMAEQQAAATGGAVAPTRKPQFGKQSEDDETDNKAADDPNGGLYNKERQAANNDGFYRNEGGKKQRKGVDLLIKTIGKLGKHKRLAFGAAGVGASLAGGIVGLFTAFTPFQVPSITQFLEDFRNAAFNNAVDKTTKRMFTQYLKEALAPNINDDKCPSTKVTRHCTTIRQNANDGPVKKLFYRWSGAEGRRTSIEQMLARNGLEIASSQSRFGDNKLYMVINSRGDGSRIDISGITNGNVTNLWDMPEVNRAGVLAEVDRIFEDSSHVKKMVYRYKVGRYLQQKHGVTRCLMYCKFKQRLPSPVSDLKKSAKAFFIRRIMQSNAIEMKVFVGCFIENCSDELKSDGVVADETTQGEPMTDFRRQKRAAMVEFATKHNTDKLGDLVKNIEEFDKIGAPKYISKQLISQYVKISGTTMTDEEAQEMVTKVGGAAKVGFIVYRVITVLVKVNSFRDMVYTLKASTTARYSEMFKTVAQEARSNNMNMVGLGAFTLMMRYGLDEQRTGPAMEEAPAYNDLMNVARTSSTNAFMRTILPQKAFAQAQGGVQRPVKQLMCGPEQDKNIYETEAEEGSAHRLSCPEYQFGTTNAAAEASLAIVTALPGVDLIVDAIEAVVGDLYEWLVENTAIERFFAVAQKIAAALAPDILADIIAGVFEWVTGKAELILTPDKMPGAYAFQALDAGSTGIAYDLGNTMAGGYLLGNDQLAEIQQEEQDKRNRDFAILPLKDRLMNPFYSNSLASQVAFSMPSDIHSAARRSFVGLLGNPVEKLASSVGSVFSLKHAYAASVSNPRANAYDIMNIGYDVNDKIFDEPDYDAWYQENCADGQQDKAWNTWREDPLLPKTGDFWDKVQEVGYLKNELTAQTYRERPNFCALIRTVANHDIEPKTAGNGASACGGGNGARGAVSGLNLADWKLTIPIGAESIEQPELASYQSEWYRPAAGGGQEFFVDSGASGVGTTPNSKNPRSELREMKPGGSEEADWSSSNGRHVMIIKQKVTELAGGRNHVVVGQIHDAADDTTVFRLEGDQLWITKGDEPHGHLLGTIAIGQVFTVGFDVSNDVVSYYFSPTGEDNPPMIEYKYNVAFSGGYFKAGSYYQGGTDGGKARVVILGLSVNHTDSGGQTQSLGLATEANSGTSSLGLATEQNSSEGALPNAEPAAGEETGSTQTASTDPSATGGCTAGSGTALDAAAGLLTGSQLPPPATSTTPTPPAPAAPAATPAAPVPAPVQCGTAALKPGETCLST